jgi:putative endonuclease
MAQHNDTGKEGEKAAQDYLLAKGYTILETNWSFQKAEIDIIAQKDNKLIAVEVKTRSSLEFGLPQEFVKPKKIQLLVKALDGYIQANNIGLEIRFDIIAIHKTTVSYEIEHLEDAFFHF